MAIERLSANPANKLALFAFNMKIIVIDHVNDMGDTEVSSQHTTQQTEHVQTPAPFETDCQVPRCNCCFNFRMLTCRKNSPRIFFFSPAGAFATSSAASCASPGAFLATRDAESAASWAPSSAPALCKMPYQQRSQLNGQAWHSDDAWW